MADKSKADGWLDRIASRAEQDARRAGELVRVIQVIGNHHTGALVTFTTDFIADPDTHLADAEVAKTLKSMWPTIWETTMRAATVELQEIEKRYAPLLEGEEESSP